MANRDLFDSRAHVGPSTDATNEAGGRAYGLTPRQALAQFAVTGCLGGTFYATATDQLTQVLDLARKVLASGEDGPSYVARVALYARQEGRMKDLPALLVALLTVDHGALATQVFDRVIDDAGMLRNFVQILRSGAVGRRSLGTRPRRLVRQWFAARTDEQIFRGSVGAKPSLCDILRMTHPRPETSSRSALYAWLCDRPYVATDLPACVQAFEQWKSTPGATLPDVPFRMLTGQPLDTAAWRQIALRATWNQTRINLNTFARHGVLEDPEVAGILAARLADPQLLERARAFPYGLMTTLEHSRGHVPHVIRVALESALNHSLRNVPELPGKVAIAIDISASMHSPVTGARRGATTVATCLDVAALFAAAIRARNPQTEAIAFHDEALRVDIDADATILQTADLLRSLPSGGTNCSKAMRMIRKSCKDVDFVVFLSDMESWLDVDRSWCNHTRTETMKEWQKLRAKRAHARLVCLDLQPYATSQAPTREDILNVGGFSDRVFDVIGRFAGGGNHADQWVDAIASTPL